MQVSELSNLLENQLGLVDGWLLSVPCKVCLAKSSLELNAKHHADIHICA